MLLHIEVENSWAWPLVVANLSVAGIALWALISTRLQRVALTADAWPLGIMGLAQLALPHMAGGIVEGLSFYPLLTGLSALMFGFRYSLLIALMTQLLNVLAGLGHFDTLGLSIWATHLIPTLWILTFLALAQRVWQRNLFVYVLVNGFFGAAFAVVFSQLFCVLSLMALGAFEWSYLSRYFLPFGLMMTFPEGFITGAFLTMLVLYRPEWLYTFRDSVYQMSKGP